MVVVHQREEEYKTKEYKYKLIEKIVVEGLTLIHNFLIKQK